MKSEIAQLRKDIDAALVEVAKKYGLSKLAATSCSYMDTTCTFKLECVKEGGKSKAAELYNMISQMESLPPLNTELNLGVSGVHTITGCNTTGTKVHALRKSDGKTYLYKTGDVAKLWARVSDKARASA